LKRGTFFVAWLAVALVFEPSRARAQDSARLAAADTLFEEGKRLMEQGEYAQACSKLAASLQMDAGVGTMLYLAECYLQTGRPASAWGQFRDAQALAASRGDAREQLARKRAAQLEGHLPTLVLAIAEPDLPGLVVRYDGRPLDRASWASPMPVDPGVHTVETSALDRTPIVTAVTVRREAVVVTVTIPPLAYASAAAPPGPQGDPQGLEPKPSLEVSSTAAAPPLSRGASVGDRSATAMPSPAPESLTPSRRPERPEHRTVLYLGLGAGVLGLAGLGFGAIEGVTAENDHESALRACNGGCAKSTTAQRDQASAKNMATLANVGFVAGGVLGVASTALLLSLLPPAPSRPGVSIRERWRFGPLLVPVVDQNVRGLGIVETW
jgi:serine/threonine-protein kinase